MKTNNQPRAAGEAAHTPTLEQIRIGIRDEQFKDREGRESRCNKLADALWVREQEHAGLVQRVAELEGALQYTAGLRGELRAAPDSLQRLADSDPAVRNWLAGERGAVITASDQARAALALAKGSQ